MFITRNAVNRPVTTLMAVLAICMGGFLAMFQLPVDMMPNYESKLVTIFVDVRGGMPAEEIERLVTEPIEKSMATMSGLKEISSVSRKDRATITLVFEDKQDVKKATLEVSERVSRIKGKLPKEIEKPVVARYNENEHPVVIMSATSTARTPEIMREMIEHDLKPALSRVPGVANVEIGGGRQRKILVEFEKAKLEMHKLSILDIIRQIGEANLSQSSGEFDYRSNAQKVQFESAFKSLEEIKNLGISSTKEGSQIRLGDVAVVRDYFLEPESYARVNNQPTVSIYVQKESGGNTVKIARGVLDVVEKYQKTLPSDMGIGISVDQSVAIREAIGDVREALFFGALLTTIILWLFMRNILRVTVVAVAIPVAVLATFFVMLLQSKFVETLGTVPPITINIMSLLGIALGIGRMVDDSIVVFENIVFRWERRRSVIASEAKQSHEIASSLNGAPRNDINLKELVIHAAGEMGLAVASSTLVMFVIFLPIVFISPDVRRLFADVAFTVVTSLMASLVVSMTIVPLLTSRSLSRENQYGWEKYLAEKYELLMKKFPRIKMTKIPHFENFLTWALVPIIGVLVIGFIGQIFHIKIPSWVYAFSLSGIMIFLFRLVASDLFNSFIRIGAAWAVRRRYWVMGGVLLSVVFSGYIYMFHLEKEFMGDTEKKEFVIFVELPSGTKLDVSDKVVAAVEREINALPEIKSSIKTVAARVEGWSSKLYVTLVPLSERTRSVQDIMEALRPRFKSIGGEFDAFIYFSEPQSSKELVIDVFGKDYMTLRDLAVEIAKRMQSVPGLLDVKLRYKPGRPEISLRVDHERASLFGFSSKEIADTVHAMLRGLRATYFNAGDEQVETVARLSEEDRRTLDQVGQLSMVSNGRQRVVVPILQVIKFESGQTASEVWRKNKERVIQVSANRGRMSLSGSVEKVIGALKGLNVPVGYHYEIGGDYQKMMKSEKEFMYAFIIMVALVYMVLACFFESYAQPLLMLLTIPLATAGSMPALWLTKTSVNMGVYIGLLMLGGIVVSNAIILIDRIKSVVAKRGLLRSVLKAGLERSRPIFMTSLTTIGAMIPLAFSKAESADLWQPLALTVVSGIALSSFLTIFVIPAAYVILYKWIEGRKKRS